MIDILVIFAVNDVVTKNDLYVRQLPRFRFTFFADQGIVPWIVPKYQRTLLEQSQYCSSQKDARIDHNLKLVFLKIQNNFESCSEGGVH